MSGRSFGSPGIHRKDAANAHTPIAAAPRSSPPPNSPGAANSNWGPPVFVWGVWGLMLVGSLLLVAKYYPDLPSSEDFDKVPYITGNIPVTLDWLWQLETGVHREPLHKFVMVYSIKLTHKFWMPRALTILALGGMALAMIRVARRVRGWTVYTDAIFPLVLLHWALGDQRGDTMIFIFSLILAATLLLIAVCVGTRLTIGYGLLAGVCLMLLPLSGPYGLVYMPWSMLWFAYSIFLTWRSPGPHKKATAILSLVLLVAACLVLALYLHAGVERSAYTNPDSNSAGNIFKVSLGLWTAGWGIASWWVWPASGLGILALFVISIAALGRMIWRERGPSRSRCLGLLFFFGNMVVLALVFGYGRGGLGLDAAWSYYIFPILVPCYLYFIWVVYRQGATRDFVQMCLFLVAACTASLDFHEDLSAARSRCAATAELQKEIEAGADPYMILARYQGTLSALHDEGVLVEYLNMLRQAGIGPFRSMGKAPTFREMSLRLIPKETSEMEWDAQQCKGHGKGADSYLVFTLPKPTYVSAIRLRHEHSNEVNAVMGVSWRRSDQSDFPSPPPYMRYYGVETDLLICVADTIDQIRINPDIKPFDYHITELTLMVPEAKESPPETPGK